jgi:chromosome partitioning protein
MPYMTIVAVLNTKGGVGKSTLTLNLAVARALAGRDVWLIDGDRQGSSMQAIAQRATSDVLPAIAAAHYTDGPTLRAQVKQTCSKYDDILIDAGGRDSTAMRAALMLADVVLIPFLPRSVDLWAMNDMAELVAEAHSMRDGLRAYAILNSADPRGTDNADAAEAVSAFTHITYLDAPVGRRKALADAYGSGLSVLESRPRDEKAIAEITRLVDIVFTPI